MNMTPFEFFGSVFTISSFAGLAALLRSGKQITKVSILSAMLNSAFSGLIVALIGWDQFNLQPNKLWLLMGMSLLAGIGGMSLLDFMLQAIKRGGFEVKINGRDAKGSGDE